MSRFRFARLMAVVCAVVLVAAACGDDDDTADAGATETTAAPADDAGDDATDDDAGDDATDDAAAGDVDPVTLEQLDANGDGDIIIGVATPGPRDDGGYYQALVTGVEAISAENGFSAPIIVDSIPPADAATELENLARSGADIIAVGASEIADSLPIVAEQFSDIFWYCNCGAGSPPNEFYAQSQDDASEINYTAGVATALLMAERGDGDSAVFVGNQGFGFEIEAVLAFEMGMQAIDDSYTIDRVDTGSFNDVPAATEAATSAISGGAVAVYPF